MRHVAQLTGRFPAMCRADMQCCMHQELWGPPLSEKGCTKKNTVSSQESVCAAGAPFTGGRLPCRHCDRTAAFCLPPARHVQEEEQVQRPLQHHCRLCTAAGLYPVLSGILPQAGGEAMPSMECIKLIVSWPQACKTLWRSTAGEITSAAEKASAAFAGAVRCQSQG